MSELAFNYKGQRFAPPSRAVYWSVRRLRDGQRGQVDVVRDAHGLPLIVPIAIGIAGFREAVSDQHGRYRLDALDADKMQIDGTEPAYVSVPQPRKVIEIEAGEPIDGDLEHDLAVARDAAPVAGLRNAAVPTMVAPPPVVATPMVSSAIGTWPALPIPVAMSGEQYLVGEALRGLVQINMQQGNAHTAHLGRMTEMVASTLGSMQPLLLATTSRAERVESLLVELLLRQQGITPPSPPPPPIVPPPAPPIAPPPAPTVVYAMPRNAAFADEDYDPDDGYDADDDDDLDDAPIEAKGEEDMIDKINRLVEKVAAALAPVASVAQMVIGAGLGRGVFGGSGDESPRNAAGDAPSAEPEDDSEPEPSLGHLRTSHVLAISHELGPQDGSIFRTMIRAMEPDDRRMFVDRLCALPIDEAVPFAAEKVAWLKARIARSRARCADATTDANQATETDDVIDVDNPEQEYHATQHDDAADLDEPPFTDDTTADQEHDTAQHDDDRDDPIHPDDQEHERDPHLDNLADTIVPSGDESQGDAADVPEASAPITPTNNPMSTTDLATTATATEAPRSVTPDVTAQMKRIAKHLKFTEILQAQQLINNTSIAERNSWIERLMSLDPIEAAAVVRAELARRAGR